MKYIKNCLLISAVYKAIITPIKDFDYSKPPKVDHIYIFGFETYVFYESATCFSITSKV